MTSNGEHEMARAELTRLPLHSAALPQASLKIALGAGNQAEISKALDIVKGQLPNLPVDYRMAIVQDLLSARRGRDAENIARLMPGLNQTGSPRHSAPLMAVADHYMANWPNQYSIHYRRKQLPL